jgi:hypothetical protein
MISVHSATFLQSFSSLTFFLFGATAPSGPGLTHNDGQQSVGLLWTSDQPVAQTLPNNTQHSQQTDYHAPGGIRTHNLSRRATADRLLTPRGHWDRLIFIYPHMIEYFLSLSPEGAIFSYRCLMWHITAFVCSDWGRRQEPRGRDLNSGYTDARQKLFTAEFAIFYTGMFNTTVRVT